MIYCTILFSESFDKLFEVSLEAFADLGMIEGDLAVSLHNAELIAHIISLAVEVISKQLASGAELAHNVGQVKFLTSGVSARPFSSIPNTSGGSTTLPRIA